MASYDNDDVPAYEPYEEKRGPDGHVRPITPGVTYIERPDDEWQTDAKGWWDRTDWNWTKEEKQAFADKYDDTVGTIEKVDENIKMCHRFGITLEEFEQSKKEYNTFGAPKKSAIEQDYLYVAKHMRDFIETARTGVPCDATCTRTLLHSWGTIKKKHYDEFIAFLGEEDCVLDTIQLNGDCGIGAEGVERLMDCIVAKPSITSLNLMGAQMGVAGAKIIAERLVASGLTKLDISCDDIGDEGAVAIAEAWESGAKLTDLGVSSLARRRLRRKLLIPATPLLHQLRAPRGSDVVARLHPRRSSTRERCLRRRPRRASDSTGARRFVRRSPPRSPPCRRPGCKASSPRSTGARSSR